MIRKLLPVKTTLIFISIFIFTLEISYPSSVKEEGCDFIDLFRAGEYKEIIELAGKSKVKNECEKLLLAKSFERLGFYSRSNKIYRELYNQNTKYRDFAAYFIAENLEKHEDYGNASRWYRNILLDSIIINNSYQKSSDRALIVISVMERLSNLAAKNRTLLPQTLRTLKKIEQHNSNASYFIGSLYHRTGNLKNAADYYLKILNDERSSYFKIVLRQISGHFRLIEILSSKGMDKISLINLYIAYKMYDSAMIISYLLPYDSYTAHLRAYCFFKNRDYQAAAVMYDEYYSNFGDTEALLKIAYSYYYIGKSKEANSYLQKYLNINRNRDDMSEDAFYLKLQLEKNGNSLKTFIQESEFFVINYNSFEETDSLIQDTFYYVLHKKMTPLAVSFLRNTYAYIKDPEYKAWAMYMLGIYLDKSFLTGVLTQFPGSYGYFSALENVEIDRKLIRTADSYWNDGRFDEAMDIYTPLFSRGIQKEYIRNKVIHKISETVPYKYLFDIENMISGTDGSMLVEFYNFGLYDEVNRLGKKSLPGGDLRQKIIYYYLVSKISYIKGDDYSGILNAEKMIKLIGKKYFLFLPEETLKLLYPYKYKTMIRLYLDKFASENFDTCFVLSVIREESRFNDRAVSPVGALGLMQLMPDTATWINNNKISREDIFDPVQNIKLGILYLDFLDKRFDSNTAVLSAYNGGPKNVNNWISSSNGDNIQQFIEEIPFYETRNYVKKVLTSYAIYKMLYATECN
jgi:soluble lytic murein transglycosylase